MCLNHTLVKRVASRPLAGDSGSKMEFINREAHGFRKFNSYSLRVKMMCS